MEYPQRGNSILKVSLSSVVRSFRHEGAFVIHGGSLESAYVSLRDIEIELELDAGAVALGAAATASSLKLHANIPLSCVPGF